MRRFAGGVPERSKGSDCKSDGSAFEGSNPSPSTSKICSVKFEASVSRFGRVVGSGGNRDWAVVFCWRFLLVLESRAGVTQLVEFLPSKQDVASSSLVARSKLAVFWVSAVVVRLFQIFVPM